MRNSVSRSGVACLQLKVLAPVDELQRDPESRPKWIFYSALDAKTTHELYNALQASPSEDRLRAMSLHCIGLMDVAPASHGTSPEQRSL